MVALLTENLILNSNPNTRIHLITFLVPFRFLWLLRLKLLASTKKAYAWHALLLSYTTSILVENRLTFATVVALLTDDWILNSNPSARLHLITFLVPVPFPVVTVFKTAGTYKKGLCVACATIKLYYLNKYTFICIYIYTTLRHFKCMGLVLKC